MAKKPSVRIVIENQLVKKSERLLKSSRQQFCDIFLSLWKDFSSKNFVLVVSEILRFFVKVLSSDDNYSFSVEVSV